MRIAHLLLIVAAPAALAGCERESSTDRSAPPAPATAPTTRWSSPTTDFLAVTQPTTASAATQSPIKSADPLATPSSAIAYLFELMKKQDVTGVRAMMADPVPAEKLRGEVSKVAEQLHSGATWEIVQSHDDGVVAVVLYRTTFADGRQDVSPAIFVNRYDRWKVLLGPLNLKKFTPGEKQSLNKVLAWAEPRLKELRRDTTVPSTTPAAPSLNTGD